MMRPIIGIAASYSIEKQQILLRDTYTNAVLQAGGMPVILPIITDDAAVDDMLDCIDGLLLSGGGDVDPSCYGAQREPECGEPTPLRDIFELLIIKKARERRMPIFGICRGLQVLTVAYGGALIQDIPKEYGIAREMHYQAEPYSQYWHEVMLEEGGLLSRITGSDCMMTNSMHHQAIRKLPETFVIEGKSHEGIIEAVSDAENSSVLGVQFHPEYLVGESEAARAIFRYFVSKTKEYQAKKK
ncbi:MAG: gamma-glutamyl-gamma-aminobutyrate hydrolase family protein [Clostridia bacterium]|nr:gamma-glutamyl-gamma-aminobutyrate hydrolase family protein [Clostridia bacterium]